MKKPNSKIINPAYFHHEAMALSQKHPLGNNVQLCDFNKADLISVIEMDRIELGLIYEELSFQNVEKRKRADELNIANIELDFQNEEKGNIADELKNANTEKFKSDKINTELRELNVVDQKVNKKLRSSNELIKQKIEEVKKLNAELREVSAHNLLAIEKERSAIAKEIHDELSQNLVALSLNASFLKTKLKKVETKKILDEQIEIAKILVESSRTLFNSLHPSMLDEIGLEAGIKWYAKKRLRLTNIECQTHSNITDEVLPKDIILAFFRIFQEAITNILLYSKANTVDVDILKINKNLSMMVHDDGVGFDVRAVDAKQHHGLLTIRERMYSIGGKLEIDSAIGKGTTLKIEVDIP